MIDEALLSEIRIDPTVGVLKAIARMRDNFGPADWEKEDHEAMLELVALLRVLIETGQIEANLPPSITGVLASDCATLNPYLSDVETNLSARRNVRSLDATEARFRAALSNSFAYEFSQGDLDRIQTLISELRQQISASESFEAEHQQRLLRRLEKLQSELHKRVSDLDRFWGLIGDAGVAIGKFGTEAKPIVDRIREITQIVWRTQSHAEELPSGMELPSLEAPDSPDNDTPGISA